MNFFKVYYALGINFYTVQTLSPSAEAAEQTIQNEHPEAVIISVSTVS